MLLHCLAVELLENNSKRDNEIHDGTFVVIDKREAIFLSQSLC